jgi:hypothetical protein
MARSNERRVQVDEQGNTVDLDTALHDMRTAYLQCRDFGHAWRPFTARWVPDQRSYHTQLRCTRCRTVRTRYISRNGEQVSKGYVYPDGYQLKGVGRITGEDRDHLRLESVLRVLDNNVAES